MKGRKPMLTVLDNKSHRSKDEKAAREKHEPKGCACDMKPPVGLSPVAKKAWKKYVALAKACAPPFLNNLDIDALYVLCEAVAVYSDAARECGGKAVVDMINAKGIRIQGTSPYWKEMQAAGEVIRKMSEQLGFTPAGRARLGVAAAKREEEEDPMARLLGGM